MVRELVAILDFGSQYTQLIARRVRECRVYAEIYPCDISVDRLKVLAPKGIILSGGPYSVYDEGAPLGDPALFDLGLPVLGICYGMQLLGHLLGGRVARAQKREYGPATITVEARDDFFFGLDQRLDVWMSHGDRLEQIPPGFETIAHSHNSPVAALRDKSRAFFGVQFHPEVVHTPQGSAMLKNFLFKICDCSGDWTPQSFIEQAMARLREEAAGQRVIANVSGGVDSSVVAVLTHKALGDQLTCIFVDNGLLRKGEVEQVVDLFQNHFQVRFHMANAEDRFLNRLAGVTEPEQKRSLIGEEFIRVLEEEQKQIPGARFLVQGTIYPDVIESATSRGPAAKIKTHHNVGGLPEQMNLNPLEPLRELFKDEVRAVGRELGLPDELLQRHPFPGPGLAVRVVGEVTRERLAILRQADAIFIDEIRQAGWYNRVAQALAVLLPIRTVGVMGDERTYEHVVALRAVTTQDFMTADWAKLPGDLLARVSSRIINEVAGVNRVVYDISSKPPSTIEWE